MGTNYIPGRDAEFHTWQGVLVTDILARADSLGIPKTELDLLETAQKRWIAAYNAAKDPTTRSQASVKEKQEARVAFEAVLRMVVIAHITYNPIVTDQDKIGMGLPVHKNKHSRAQPITSYPRVDVNFAQVQRHLLMVTDSETKSHAMPPHAVGFEVWRKMGEPAPTSDADWQLVVQAPHSPCELHYDEANTGLRVYYRVRWINTRGVPGPWSKTVSAVIA
jgi:hypothetical protein